MTIVARGCLAIGGAAILASCTSASHEYQRSSEAQQELDKALAGRVAGKPLNCIPNYRATDMQIIDDYTIIFKDGRTVYLQTPPGGCPGIANHGNILVNRPMGTSQLCSGDINHLLDPATGMQGGSCVFDEFVPYTKQAS